VALSVLGPLRLDGSAGPVAVPGRKTREVLTMLALAAPRPLSVAALAARLWDDPPPSAVKTVQGHVSRVRSALAAAHPDAGVLQGGPTGYQLVSGADQLDVRAVNELRRRARVSALAGDDHAGAQLLHRARGLWRSEPELPATAAGEAERGRLAEEHLLLIEDHLTAMIASGSAAETVGELEALTAAHPLRERPWALRMQALYHCGRQADALQAYRTVRRRLIDEVGVEPGPQLRALEAAILAHAVPNLEPGPALPAHAASTMPVDVPHYADSGGVHVAYGIYGTGPIDVLLLNPTFIPVDAYLEEPHLAQAITGLAAGRRVIAFDRRGLGLSDPLAPTTPPTIEHWAEDAIAVLDTSRAARVHVLANADTTLIALQLAAAHPDRIATLTLVNGYARATSAVDYPHGTPPAAMADLLHGIHTPGLRAGVDVLSWIAPSVAADPRFRTWWDAVGRRGASPRTAELMHQLVIDADVRETLALVTAPVLVLSRLGCGSYDPGHSRYLAHHLPDASLVEHPDPDDPWFLGDVTWILERFETFTRHHHPQVATENQLPSSLTGVHHPP
jgi:DNA-binding SARP family transcriptional activator/pimeloyl-ACP methyl ester carboxylesterase